MGGRFIPMFFDKWTEGDTLEERRKLFENKFDTNNLGATQI